MKPRCETCQHYEPLLETGTGLCVCYSPVADEDRDDKGIWPVVISSNRCGDYAAIKDDGKALFFWGVGFVMGVVALAAVVALWGT